MTEEVHKFILMGREEHSSPLFRRPALRQGASAGTVLCINVSLRILSVIQVRTTSGCRPLWAARILGLDTCLIIAGEDPEHVRESQVRLARVGVENVAGYLADGVAGWIKSGFELDYIPQITVQDFVELRKQEPNRIAVLDVPELGEVAGGAIENSVCIPLGKLKSSLTELELDREKLLVVHCKGGYRSSIATSILRRAGFRDIRESDWRFRRLENGRSPLRDTRSVGA